jgi:hypothetical protein
MKREAFLPGTNHTRGFRLPEGRGGANRSLVYLSFLLVLLFHFSVIVSNRHAACYQTVTL